jgi:hypothetical protein
MSNRRFPDIDDIPAPFARSNNSEKQGQYIWRTAGDSDVRSEHAVRNGKTFSWDSPPKGGHPGEDFGCRCTAETVVKHDCEQKKQDVLVAQKEVKEQTDILHDLLIKLDKLIEENNQLVKNAMVSLGARAVSHILTLPFERMGAIGEVLHRYFEGVLSNELVKSAENFMSNVWLIKDKVKYVSDQVRITQIRLSRAAYELEKTKEGLGRCKKY